MSAGGDPDGRATRRGCRAKFSRLAARCGRPRAGRAAAGAVSPSQAVSAAIQWLWSGGRGHRSPRLPQIPLRGIPHKRLYVPRPVMSKRGAMPRVCLLSAVWLGDAFNIIVAVLSSRWTATTSTSSMAPFTSVRGSRRNSARCRCTPPRSARFASTSACATLASRHPQRRRSSSPPGDDGWAAGNSTRRS